MQGSDPKRVEWQTPNQNSRISSHVNSGLDNHHLFLINTVLYYSEVIKIKIN